MKLASFLLPSLLYGVAFAASAILPVEYDVVWDTPSQTNGSASSMPCGGGDIGLNVWAENGIVVDASIGARDAEALQAPSYSTSPNLVPSTKTNSLLKLGRVRLAFDPNPFSVNETSFEQRLVINDGYVRFSGANDSVLALWVDVHNPVIHADFSSNSEVHLTAGLESWRTEDRLMTDMERSQSSWQQFPNVTVYTGKDTTDFYNDGVLSYHRNNDTTVFDFTVHDQGLDQYKDSMYNPLAGNTMGLWMSGDGMSPDGTTTGHYINTSYTSWNLQSNAARSTFNLTVLLHQNQTSSAKEWQSQLESNIATTTSNHSNTVAWFHSFWNRSHIIINPTSPSSDPSFQIGRNYHLFRYTLACNAYGSWPTRFNGGLFTFDPYFVDNSQPFTPDYRRWSGGTFTAQNQRLVYWPIVEERGCRYDEVAV